MAEQVLIAGQWQDSAGTSTFTAVNPTTCGSIPGDFPVSPWTEVEAAIAAAAAASRAMRGWPGERFARFLERYADRIEARAEELVSLAHQETGLPVSPRLQGAELPRTTNQLRQAAAAARSGSWSCPTIDTANNIIYALIGASIAVFIMRRLHRRSRAGDSQA